MTILIVGGSGKLLPAAATNHRGLYLKMFANREIGCTKNDKLRKRV